MKRRNLVLLIVALFTVQFFIGCTEDSNPSTLNSNDELIFNVDPDDDGTVEEEEEETGSEGGN